MIDSRRTDNKKDENKSIYDHENEVYKINESNAFKTVKKYFEILSESLIKNNLSLENIISCLNIIQNNIQYIQLNDQSGEFYLILSNIWKTVYDPALKLNIYITNIVELLNNYSIENTIEFCESDFQQLFIAMLQTSFNQSLNSKILYIMCNVVTSNDNDLITWTIQNNYINIFGNIFFKIFQPPIEAFDSSLYTILFPVVHGIIHYLNFIEIIPKEDYNYILKIAIKIIQERENYSFFNTFVPEIIQCITQSLDYIGVKTIVDCEFYQIVLEIINDDLSPYLNDAFYFLGKLFSFPYEVIHDFSLQGLDVPKTCMHLMKLQDNNKDYLDGLFYFLGNFILIIPDSIDNLFREGFFKWCTEIVLNISFHAQKSFCYFFLSVLFCSNESVIMDLLSDQNNIDCLFNIIGEGEHKISLNAIRAFHRVFSIIDNLPEKLPHFTNQICTFLENIQPTEDPEVNILLEELNGYMDEYL